LESLDINLRSGDNINACKNSRDALNSINLHSHYFASLEPYYNWPDIKELLESITFKYC